MSKEKSEKDVRNVPITVRLNEEEHEKLKQCAAACGLSAAEFMRQLCKGNAPQPKPEKGTDYKPTSPLMKEELRKLDEITAQVRYMSKHNISTLSDLHADREKNQIEMNKLIDYRQHLRNKVRRATPAEKEKIREEKQGVTEQITELRKRLKYADGIERRSAHIDDCLNQIHDTIENQRSNRQKQSVKTDRRREESLR